MHDVSTSSQRSERRMRMTYTYARVQQNFTKANYPSCWSYPINLLMHIKETDEVETGCLQTQEMDLGSFEELVQDKEYQTYLPQVSDE